MKRFAFIALVSLAACDAVPLNVPNDTTQVVQIDIHARRYPTPIQLEEVPPGTPFGSRHCWRESDAILLATPTYRNPIVLDPKDFCDPDDCDCEIPVSQFLKRMTPSFVLNSQFETCAGRGPFLQTNVRAKLCAAYADPTSSR